VVVGVYPDMEALATRLDPARWYLFSRRGRVRYDTIVYRDGDAMVFGSESMGLPASLLADHADRSVFMPIMGNLRSINLSAAVHVAIYEAHRQENFKFFA
jgi:tRNA (cytidine/uridine-2'-O-)-methyltransferase